MTIFQTDDLCVFLLALIAAAAVVAILIAISPPSFAQVTNSSGSQQIAGSGNDDSDRIIYVEGYITEDADNGHTSIPISGAAIYFIKNQTIVNKTTTSAIGYYDVVITPGTYSVVTAAQGFQTLMTEETFDSTRTLNRALDTIPYNGLVTYAVNPVIETSPGRPVSCTIAVENSQLVDQYVTFSLQSPDNNWVGWCPDGEMLGLRSGDSGTNTVMFQYNGDSRGASVWYVLVSAGSYYARIPVVVIVKDMPYESLDLYSNYPQRTIKPGEIAHFEFDVNNLYARDKPLALSIEKPKGWGATTGNGTLLYVAEEQQTSSDFWVYAPADAAPGNYTINLTLKGQDVRSNTLQLQVQVVGLPAYDALIQGYKPSSEGYPCINVSEGDTFDVPVRVYNNGEFPLDVIVSAEIGDNWAYYMDGAPWNKIEVEPGGVSQFVVRSKVPNGTAGNYTARIYLEATGQDLGDNDQDYMLMAQLNVTQRAQPPASVNAPAGILLAAGTAGTIMASLLATAKKRRRY